MTTQTHAFRRALMAGFCASALLMAACSGGDKVPAEEITVDAASLELTRQDESALSKHFEIDVRDGTEAETLRLLTALSMEDATFGERQIAGSTVVYSDWSATQDGTVMTAERVELVGLHEGEDGPTVDRLYMGGLDVEAFDSEGEPFVKVMDMTAESLSIVEPSAELFADLVDVMMARENGTDTVTDLGEGQPFRALHLQDMTADIVEDGNTVALSVKQIVYGQDMEAELADLVVESITLDFASEGGQVVDLAMDGMTVMEFDQNQFIESMDTTANPMQQLFQGFAPPARPPYRLMDVGKVELVSEWLDLTMEGIEGRATTRGGVTVLETVWPLATVTLKDMSETPLAPYMAVMEDNGMTEITYKGSSTTTYDMNEDRIAISDGKLEIDEGLRLDCDYGITGTGAAAAYLEDLDLDPPVLDLPEDGDIDEDAMQAYFEAQQAYSEAQAEAFELIKLEGLNCIVQDVPGNSLVERGYAVASAITGRPVAVLKGSAKTMIALGSLTAQSDFQRDLMDTVGSGLIDFIDTPGQTMTVTLRPDSPVGMKELVGEGGGEPSLEPLNLTVTVQ